MAYRTRQQFGYAVVFIGPTTLYTHEYYINQSLIFIVFHVSPIYNPCIIHVYVVYIIYLSMLHRGNHSKLMYQISCFTFSVTTTVYHNYKYNNIFIYTHMRQKTPKKNKKHVYMAAGRNVPVPEVCKNRKQLGAPYKT